MRDYLCVFYPEDNGKLLIWEKMEHIFVYIERTTESNKAQHIPCFKNVGIVRQNGFTFPIADIFKVCIDFMGTCNSLAIFVSLW